MARTGETYDIQVRNLRARNTLIDDSTDAVVTFLMRRGQTLLDSGALAWEALEYEDCWAGQATLPSTPGDLTFEVEVNATIDGQAVTGRRQASLRVTS